jgi:hypothetical protein
MKNKFIILLCLFIIGNTNLFGINNYFKTTKRAQLPDAVDVVHSIKKYKTFELDEQGLRRYLQNAPLEFVSNGKTIPLEIPLPNGEFEIFNIVESPILSLEVAAQHPEIKTYSGNSQLHKEAVIRITLTSDGFSAIILNVEGDVVYFEPYTKVKSNFYFNYFTKDVIVPKQLKPRNPSCNIGELPLDRQKKIELKLDESSNNKKTRNNTGANLKTYRLAIAVTGEFTAVHGGTAIGGLNRVVNYVNTINAIYRNELAVAFTLVSGTNLIYTNATTDPYTNNDQSAMLTENQTNIDNVIGDLNYDIGHALSFDGIGTSGGGIAISPALCITGDKAQGVSGEGGTPFSQVFFDQTLAHEIGHQFNMSHSYNSSSPVCTTREPATSVEVGAGATIMSYGFTCSDNGDDNYFTSTTNGPILQFHSINYSQAVTYMGTTSCGTSTVTGNTPPVVTMPSAFTIPKSTPFALTCTATDVNGDNLTYCWEGTNIGLITPVPSTFLNTTQPPFFRTYEATATGTRNYPLLSAILNGTNTARGDKLPSIGIATTHRCTVRDNNVAGGGVSFGSVTITINGGIGPFLETTNLSGTFSPLTTQTITWSVNGTNVGTPNVKISLSTDGGITISTSVVGEYAQ